MSLFTTTSELLSLGPKTWTDGDVLRARTSLVVQILALFSYCRRLAVDPRSRTVDMSDRSFWLHRRESTIPFDDIDYIDYDFGSFGTAWGGALTHFERTDQIEQFTVSLVLKQTGEKVRLFRFSGEGSVGTGWRGVLIGGDNVIDLQGSQEDASRSFVDDLQLLLDVPIGKPVLPAADRHGNRYQCADCGRPNPANRQRCQYCGGDVEREEEEDESPEP